MISVQSKGLATVFSSATAFESINSLALSLVYGPTLTSLHDYWKNYSFDYHFVGKVMSVLFNMLSRFLIENMYFPGGPQVKTMLLLQGAWV